MINSINSLPYVNGVQSQQNVSSTNAQAPVINPMQKMNLSGMDALAAYNSVAVTQSTPKKIQPTLPTVLQPEAVHSLKGDRVYSSNGTLKCIISKNDKTSTVYYTDVMAPNDVIRKIETFDNKTGKLINLQENYSEIKQGQMPKLFLCTISEFDPNTGKKIKTTNYSNGKLEYVLELEHRPDGSTRAYEILQDKSCVIDENKVTGIDQITTFDKKGQIEKVDIIDRNTESSKTVFYNNGKVSRIEKSSAEPIPNTTKFNPQVDGDLVPFESLDPSYSIDSILGEKLYYTNGIIERSTLKTPEGEIVYTYNPDGLLTGIADSRDPNKVKNIVFLNDQGERSYSVEEVISPSVSKTTVFNEDGTKHVHIVDTEGNVEKIARYRANNSLASYVHIENDLSTVMTYDKFGNLKSINEHKKD